MKFSFYGALLLAGMAGVESFGGEVAARPREAAGEAARETVVSIAAAQSPAVRLKASDSGRSIALKPGQLAEIRLEGNYTTGYTWHFLVPREGVAIVKEDYEAAGNGLAGAPGVAVVTLKATRPGTYPVVGYYYRTWEGLKPAADQSFVVNVTVAK